MDLPPTDFLKTPMVHILTQAQIDEYRSVHGPNGNQSKIVYHDGLGMILDVDAGTVTFYVDPARLVVDQLIQLHREGNHRAQVLKDAMR